MSQLPLDLQFMASQGRDDFIIGESNQLAATWINRWPDWPGQYRVLNLVGPAASGKGHLASIWCQLSGATAINSLDEWRPDTDIGHVVLAAPVPGPQWPEEPLFHIINGTAREGRSILITSREPVAGLDWQLADLRSRLRSVNLVGLERPDDALLRRLLEKYFADRQLAVAGQVLDYMVSRMERSFQAVQTIAAAMDRRSLATHRRLTLPLAREIMTEFAEGAHARQPALPTGLTEEEKT